MMTLAVFTAGAVKGTAVLMAACLASLVMRRASAASRHLVWTLAAASLLVLPVLMVAVPAWEVPVTAPDAASFLFRIEATAFSASQPTAAVPARSQTHSEPGAGLPGLGWADWLLMAWAAGALAGLSRLAVGVAVSWRLCRKARPMADEDLVHELAGKLGIVNRVRVLQSDRASMPLTFGRSILLPADASGWPEERRRMVLAHELAHIRRQDWVAQLLARVAFSLYWFHPLAWFAARQFTKERERACDDLVLSLGARPSDYAAQLLEVARSLAAPASTAWATVTMARRSQLEGRLLAILDSGLRRGFISRLGLIGALLAAACFVVPLAAMRPGPAIPALSPVLARIAPPALALAEPAAQAATPKPDEYQMVGVLCRLGIETQLAKEYAQAEGYYQRALAAVYPDSLEAARIYNYRGILFQNENRTGEAEHDFLSALAIEEKTSMKTSIANADRANTLQLYSGLLRDTGRADQAEIQANLAAQLRRGYLTSLAFEDLMRSRRSLRGWDWPHRIGPESEGWVAPVPIEKTEPAYTDLARLAKLQGAVVLNVEIGTDGKVHTVFVYKSLGLGLDESAMDVVKMWRFEPATKDGQPVAVGAAIEVNFRLL